MHPLPPRKISNKFRRRFPLPFERRLLVSVLLAGLPGTLLALLLLWLTSFSLYHKIEGTILVLGLWLVLALSACGGAVNSLRVLSNVIGSMKEEDFSFRATQATRGDALGDLAIEVNNLARALEAERLGALETANLFRNVMAEAGDVMFAFSDDNRLRLLNRAAVALLGNTEEQLIHRSADELGIGDLVNGQPAETLTRSFAGIERRWIVRRAHFRLHGVQHRLLVMSEASEALRAEERLAWQKLVRVLSHEINNSLAPIKSIAFTLRRASANVALPEALKQNLEKGLEVIANRSDSLNRFLQSYAQLAKLPIPNPRISSLETVVRSVVGLESRLPVSVLSAKGVSILVDSDQLEQALINLTRNAVDAVLMKGGTPDDDAVTISWRAEGPDLELWIHDRGIGLPDTQNLFVPFYTTKDHGAGIGLVLSRQIIEAHGGRLTLKNRREGPGCEAKIILPRCVISASAQLRATVKR